MGTKMEELLARARAAKEAATEPAVIEQAKTTLLGALAKQAVIPAPPPITSTSTALAALKAKMAVAVATNTPVPAQVIEEKVQEVMKEVTETTAAGATSTGMHGEVITYNPKQQEFISLISAGKSCVLIGAAGTGKTTCTKGGIAALLQNPAVPVLQTDGHKHLVPGTPGVVIISYTRRAVNNIRKVQDNNMKNNCITAHKLLEYQPIYYDVENEETGEIKKTMKFEASRNANNPLPSTMHTIIVEESSMLSVALYKEQILALPHPVQWVFIGDIQQLPPIFGPAILGFKMAELPVVELTEVYRQALDSPIIRLAHRILSGVPIPATEYADWHFPGQLTIRAFQNKWDGETAVRAMAAFYKKCLDTGLYNPEEDMILTPYNEACGTIELNKHLANHLARKRGALTYEVVAGFNKCYYSEGDRVLYDKEDAEIVSIFTNPAYSGAKTQPASATLDYWGHNPNLAAEMSKYKNQYGTDDVDFLLESVASTEDRVNQASHKIVVRLLDSMSEVELTTAGDVNKLLHSYALTVHKAQGSEWRKVFLLFHSSQAAMTSREMLYTAVTRAREELHIMCEPDTFTKGIRSQRIKGNTLAEKAEHFKGKYNAADIIGIAEQIK